MLDKLQVSFKRTVLQEKDILYVWVDWATRASCYIISNPVGNMDLNSDWTAVPCATTTTGHTGWVSNTVCDQSKNTDLHIHSLVVLLSFLQELLQAARRHVFCNEYNLWATDGGWKIGSFTGVNMCVGKKRRKREGKTSYPSLALLHV